MNNQTAFSWMLHHLVGLTLVALRKQIVRWVELAL